MAAAWCRWTGQSPPRASVCARSIDHDPTEIAVAWSEALKVLVSVMLESIQPIFVVWGPDRIFLYNDAFIPIAGRKQAAKRLASSERRSGKTLPITHSWRLMEPETVLRPADSARK